MARSPNHLVSLALVLMLGYTVLMSSSGDCVSFPIVAGSVMRSGASASGKDPSPMERRRVAKSPAMCL